MWEIEKEFVLLPGTREQLVMSGYIAAILFALMDQPFQSSGQLSTVQLTRVLLQD